MNAAAALDWCVTHAAQGFPDDIRTAAHVREWLAAKAQTHAQTPAEFEAVDRATVWAWNLPVQKGNV